MNFLRDIAREVIDVARIPVDTMFNPDDEERDKIRKHRERMEAIKHKPPEKREPDRDDER